jgi:hypothetical protein
MTTDLQLDTTERELKLLIEWTPRWHSFVTSIRPALNRKELPLAGEIGTQIFPLRRVFGAWAAEAFLLFVALYLPAKLASLHPYMPPPRPKSDVIYYSGIELPQTEDSGGAPAGHSGKPGGREAFHRTQVIKVAREQKLTEQILDAPKLHLPASAFPVANLLAIQKIQGPPPSEGLRSSLRASPLPKIAPVPPPPEIAREDSRKNPTLTATVIPPAPVTPRELPQARFPQMHTDVVPPPVSAPQQENSNARLTLPTQSVIAPPPSVARDTSRMAGQLPVRPSEDIIPPPVQANSGMVTGRTVPTLATNVVPPPPNVSGGTSPSARGMGRAGSGAGAPLDLGTPTAPPANAGGNSTNAAAIISSTPGTNLGTPTTGARGALAMSPAGGTTPGIGGTGGGSGNATGPDTGSAKAGASTATGTGAAKSGTGPGASTTAKTGTSGVPGPGGAGTGSRPGVPNTQGISVQGGSIVTLPSFGNTPADPTVANRSSASGPRGPGITVVATSRSGGAFNFYGALKGDRVYTIYLDTTLGMVVLQFADPNTETQAYSEELLAPEPLHKTLPQSADHTRVVISCTIDRAGNLKNLKVVDGTASALATKILPALDTWRFRPVLRGETPVEVTAILGFNIDTR